MLWFREFNTKGLNLLDVRHHCFPLHWVPGILISRRWNRDVVQQSPTKTDQVLRSLQGLFRRYSGPALQCPGPLSVAQSWLCDASAMCFILLSPSKKRVCPPPEVSDYTEERDRELCTRASNVTSAVIKAIHCTKTSVMGQSCPPRTTCAYCSQSFSQAVFSVFSNAHARLHIFLGCVLLSVWWGKWANLLWRSSQNFFRILTDLSILKPLYHVLADLKHL